MSCCFAVIFFYAVDTVLLHDVFLGAFIAPYVVIVGIRYKRMNSLAISGSAKHIGSPVKMDDHGNLCETSCAGS